MQLPDPEWETTSGVNPTHPAGGRGRGSCTCTRTGGAALVRSTPDLLITGHPLAPKLEPSVHSPRGLECGSRLAAAPPTGGAGGTNPRHVGFIHFGFEPDEEEGTAAAKLWNWPIVSPEEMKTGHHDAVLYQRRFIYLFPAPRNPESGLGTSRPATGKIRTSRSRVANTLTIIKEE